MGVRNLWKILEAAASAVSIQSLSGKVCAVDASIWIMSAIAAHDFNQERNLTRKSHFLYQILRKILVLLEHQIVPHFVFDGPPPEIKMREVARRIEMKNDVRREARAIAKRHLAKAIKGVKTGRAPATQKEESNTNLLMDEDTFNQAFEHLQQLEELENNKADPILEYEKIVLNEFFTLIEKENQVTAKELKWLKKSATIGDVLTKLEELFRPNYRKSEADEGDCRDQLESQLKRCELVSGLKALHKTIKDKIASEMLAAAGETRKSGEVIRFAGDGRVGLLGKGDNSDFMKAMELPKPPTTYRPKKRAKVNVREIVQRFYEGKFDASAAYLDELLSNQQTQKTQQTPNSTQVNEQKSEEVQLKEQPSFKPLMSFDTMMNSIPDISSSFPVFLNQVEETVEKSSSKFTDWANFIPEEEKIELEKEIEQESPDKKDQNERKIPRMKQRGKLLAQPRYRRNREKKLTFDEKVQDSDEEKLEKIQTQKPAALTSTFVETERKFSMTQPISEITPQNPQKSIELQTSTLDSTKTHQKEDGNPSEDKQNKLRNHEDMEQFLFIMGEKNLTEPVANPRYFQGGEVSTRQTTMSSETAFLVKAETSDLVKALLSALGLGWTTAAGEAEAECARLEYSGMVDFVVTDDCDYFLFGGRRCIRNFSDFLHNSGKLERYDYTSIEKNLGLNLNRLQIMALLLGCDYCQGIRGVGTVNAMEIVGYFDSVEDLEMLQEWADNPTAEPPNIPRLKPYFKLHKEFRNSWVFPKNFPSKNVLEAFRHPKLLAEIPKVARKPVNQDIEAVQKLLQACVKLDEETINTTISRVKKALSSFSAPKITDYLHSIAGPVAEIQSTRIKKVVDKMTSDDGPPRKRVNK